MSANGPSQTTPATPQVRSTSTALVRHEAIEPQTMAELKDFAKIASDSQFFGGATPQQAMMIALAGRDLGFSYTQALRMFDIIKGKPCLKADGIMAACLAKPEVCEYFDQIELTETRAVYETQRRGRAPVRYVFTIEDAQRAGLINEMYKKHPKRMLSARCKAYLGRDVYPDILGGLVTDDEAVEIAQSRAPVRVEVTAIESTPEPIVRNQFTGLVAHIRAAANQRELASVAAEIKASDLTADERAALRDVYAQRAGELKQPAPPVSKPHVEEPTADAPPDAEFDRGDSPENY